MKIVILGSTGMLGWTVSKYMIERYGEDSVYLSYRGAKPPFGKNHFFFDAANNWESNLGVSDLGAADYVINCIGVIKPMVKKVGIKNTVRINSLFPHELADYCKAQGIKLIHITTDCVFSGKEGGYEERTIHDAEDEYGKSKSLGEPENCMTIRTSIIGEELQGGKSLIEWAKSQMGNRITGFTNHFWNGITTLQYAKVCDQIMEKSLYQEGIQHVFSPNAVSKYELLWLINNKFQLQLEIGKADTAIKVDRTMKTCKHLVYHLDIPEIADQIKEM